MYFLPINASALGSKVLDVFQIIFLLWTVWTNIMHRHHEGQLLEQIFYCWKAVGFAIYYFEQTSQEWLHL